LADRYLRPARTDVSRALFGTHAPATQLRGPCPPGPGRDDIPIRPLEGVPAALGPIDAGGAPRSGGASGRGRSRIEVHGSGVGTGPACRLPELRTREAPLARQARCHERGDLTGLAPGPPDRQEDPGAAT